MCLWFCYDYDVVFLPDLYLFIGFYLCMYWGIITQFLDALLGIISLRHMRSDPSCVLNHIRGRTAVYCNSSSVLSFHIVASFKHAELLLSCSVCLIWDISNFNKTSLCCPSRNAIPCPWLVISWLAEDLPLFSSPGWAVLTCLFHGA